MPARLYRRVSGGKRQQLTNSPRSVFEGAPPSSPLPDRYSANGTNMNLSLIHISEPTRRS
eukprot:7130040-Prymnesium_polylepis.1